MNLVSILNIIQLIQYEKPFSLFLFNSYPKIASNPLPEQDLSEKIEIPPTAPQRQSLCITTISSR